MVFSSLEFIYLFLPPVLLVFFILRHMQWEKGIIWWLIAASLAFYAWWSPLHLILLMGSVGVNYGLHRLILKTGSKPILAMGITANLVTLAYFKYADFLIGNFNAITGAETSLLNIILPLAISFFTFQQISFLYDTYVGEIAECDFAKYCLFVVFFPQLIAGPIVLQKHTIPQFILPVFRQRALVNLSVGSTLFMIGLFKKIVLADGVAPIANSVYGLAEMGQVVPFEAAWMGAIAYSFQIYFDFSGYCDMALGLARMFGIRLPLNFNSPYKALNIVDFWRRWHITLSTFLRNFLYIPLGGNRKGPVRRYVNLGVTMLLGGLWHGASWNFVFWGLLHGLYLAANNFWSTVVISDREATFLPPFISRFLAQSLTLLSVIVAWVFFRAETFSGAGAVLKGMFGFSAYPDEKLWSDVLQGSNVFWVQAIALTMIVLWLPNSMEIVKNYRPVINVKKFLREAVGISAHWQQMFIWRPSLKWSIAMLAVGLIGIIQIYRLDELTEFIYFNF
ncbi:MAG: acyltransferase [Hyphomicrobiales bacterium]|nr:MAG: acyltransferase [Hyphomicrobiales bacterium]